jgi:hypothetical protein
MVSSEGPMEIVTFVVLVAAVLAVVIPAIRLRRRQQDRQLTQAWWSVNELVEARPGLALVQVVENYQYARDGTKSHVRWQATGYVQDTWFWHNRRSLHEYLVIAPHRG